MEAGGELQLMEELADVMRHRQLKWVRIALSEFNQCRSHSITVSLSEPASERIMCMESTSFHELHCDSSHVGELRFSYIY